MDNREATHLENSFEFEINDNTPKISCIEYPGVVHNNIDLIIEALGGEKSLSETLGKPLEYSRHIGGTGQSVHSDVFLRLNPKDRFSKFLGSNRLKRSDLLVKVKRCKETGNICDVKLVGVVTEKIVFDLMADFYCCPPDISRDINIDIEQEMNESSKEPLFIPPSVFSRILLPFQIKFDDTINSMNQSSSSEEDLKELSSSSNNSDVSNAAESVDNDVLDTLNDEDIPENLYDNDDISRTPKLCTRKVNRRQLTESMSNSAEASNSLLSKLTRHTSDDNINVVCKYNCDLFPIEPPKLSASIHIDMELLIEYQKLFDERPIWLRSTLNYYSVASVSKWKKKHVLARTCFLFTDGPWRGTLCRFGYDPRKSIDSRVYQTIDFRDSYFRTVSWKTQFNLMKNAKPTNYKPSLEEIQFKIPPTRPSQLYQLIDIEEISIQDLIENMKPLDTCCKESGWFSREDFIKIRDLMLISSKRMRNEKVV